MTSDANAPGVEVVLESASETEEKPVDRIRKIRWSVRAIWWSAVVLTSLFIGVAIWTGLVRRDWFGLFYAVLAGFCALAGYGALTAVKTHTPPSA